MQHPSPPTRLAATILLRAAPTLPIHYRRSRSRRTIPKPPVQPGTASEVHAAATQEGCFNYITNSDFEADNGWFGQPLSNVSFSEQYWNTGLRSATFNTNFYSNPALWQPISVPSDAETVTLTFYSAVIIPDPEERVLVNIRLFTFVAEY